MEIKYDDRMVLYDAFFKPSKTQNQPSIKINDLGYKYYLLIMYDPDAVVGTYWHWIVSNIKKDDITTGEVILPYKGPAPPDEKIHRYFFELYGSNTLFKAVNFKERSVSLHDGKKKLGLIDEPLLMDKFLSQREKKGGKKRKTKRKKRVKNKISRKK